MITRAMLEAAWRAFGWDPAGLNSTLRVEISPSGVVIVRLELDAGGHMTLDPDTREPIIERVFLELVD